MLYYNFKDYQEFKELFGMVEHGNGAKSRKNKILLAFLKQKELLHDYVHHKSSSAAELINCRSMSTLNLRLFWTLSERAYDEQRRIVLLDHSIYTSDFDLDDWNGLCEDGDYSSIRYVNNSGRVYKMRAGKFIRKIILGSKSAKYWNEQVTLWFCEEFTRSWEAHASESLPNLKLVVDHDFYSIYNGDYLKGCFDSCMVDEDVDYFYRNCVSARAASLQDNEGLIVARCIIFDECKVEKTGEILRLAERQYSSGSNELLKRVLVNKLISAGEIDGYKRVGADCHSPRAFILNNGEALSERLSIKCVIEDKRDTFIPYMDSFKYYSDCDQCCYNYEGYHDYTFENTSGFPWEENWDEYHDRYTESEVLEVYYRGRRMTCSEDDLDDFRWVDYEQEYHHEDDVIYCDECCKYALEDNAYYSNLTEGWYCSEDCLIYAEDSYKERNWYYSDLLEEYFETVDELTKEETDWYERHNYVYSDVTEEWYKTVEEKEKEEEKYK